MTSATKLKFTGARVLGLDILRVVAIFLVLGRHMTFDRSQVPTPVWLVFAVWMRGGWVGVDLFFVLSGFLVSGLLFADYRKRGKLSVGRFYFRRGWKIYPPFLVLIGVTALVDIIRGNLARWQYVVELCFLQNYLEGRWNHTWSLAVEEHFYLVLPALLAGLVWLGRGRVDPFKPLFGVVALTALALLSLRTYLYYSTHSFSYLGNLFPTHLRLDSLLFGVLIAYLYHFHNDWFVETLGPRRRWLIAGGIAALLPAFLFQLEKTPFIFTAGLTLFYLGGGAILAGVLLCELPRNRVTVTLGMIGAYSYSIYLWHMPVLVWGMPALERLVARKLGFAVEVSVYLVGSILAGIIMAKLVEVPSLRLRDRWLPARGTSHSEGAPAQPSPPVLDAESASGLLLNAGD
ncbi:acyltransferase [Singulisphaera sp. Ch08]|uniref:Acyltransferase n=1 Tax=Singulisphaera sp. Ch08 TaxID=3120278 RepID=A0AAU7CLY2_9BACT